MRMSRPARIEVSILVALVVFSILFPTSGLTARRAVCSSAVLDRAPCDERVGDRGGAHGGRTHELVARAAGAAVGTQEDDVVRILLKP